MFPKTPLAALLVVSASAAANGHVYQVQFVLLMSPLERARRAITNQSETFRVRDDLTPKTLAVFHEVEALPNGIEEASQLQYNFNLLHHQLITGYG